MRTAKRIVLDTLGCAIGGYTAGPSQIANQARERRQREAGGDGFVQRHQDEPRSRGVRQRRDDPLSGFQRRLYQPRQRASERHDRRVADAGRIDGTQRPRSHHRNRAHVRSVLQSNRRAGYARDRPRPFHGHRTCRGGRRRPPDGTHAAAVGACDRHHRRRQHCDQPGPGGDAVELEGVRIRRSLPQGDILGATRAGRHDGTEPGVRRARRFLQRDQPQAVQAAEARRRRRAVRHHARLHQALRARPVCADRRAGRGGSAPVLQGPGRYTGGQHPGLAQRDQGHGGQPRQVAAANARDRRPQHAVFGGGRA